MQLRKETEVDLADRHSGESISGVPIKKRLFRLSQCSSSPSQETCSMPHNCKGQPKKYLLEAESSVSENSADLALDTNKSPKDVLKSSSALSGQRSYLCGDVNTSLLHGNSVQANHEEMEFKKATGTFKGSNRVEDLNVDNRSSLDLDMEKGKQLSQPRKSEMIIGDRIIEGKFASTGVSAFKGVETTSTSCEDKKYDGLNPLKQEKVETCSLDLPLAKGLRCLQQTIYDDLDSKYSSVHCHVNREKWDLNVPMEVWDANSNDSVMEHDMDDRLDQKAMHQQKVDRCLVQTALVTIGSDLTSGISMVERSQYDPRLTNLGMPADGNRDYEGGLDLQLRPPSRPELHINWGKIAPPHLSLSLAGNLSDASCSVVKPEPCENSSQKGTETFQLSSLKSVGIRHVKSEPCDGSFQGEASKVAVSFDRESSLGRVVKSEPPEELEGKLPNSELDNHRLTSCRTEVPPGKIKHVVLNSNAVPDAIMLHDDSPVMPGNAKIKSGESTCLALDTTTVSGPNILCKVEDVLTDICTHQDAEGSTSKSLDIVVGSVISDAKGCNAKETEIREIDDMAATLHRESVVSDLKEPMACDCMSEGSAEMDCSDGEYYASPKVVAGDDLHMDTDKNSVPCGGNQEGVDLPAEIQIEQVNGNEQQVDAPQGLSGAGDNITRLGGGDVEGEGGELDPVPQCAKEVSCEYEEKGVHGNVLQCANEVPCVYENKVHGNVATDSIGSDGIPVMMETHLDTKGKQIVSEEARIGHSAENFDGSMCRDKKEASCNFTTDLHESSATRVPRASSNKRLTKPCQGAAENHLGKEKASEMKSNSIKVPNAIAKTNKDYVGRRQLNIRYASVSTKHPELPERDSDVGGIAIKYVDDAGKYSDIKNADNRGKQRQSKKVSSPTIRSFGQSKPISARLVPSGTEKERSIDKQRQDRLYSQGRRPSKFESKNNQDQPVGKFDSDYMNTRRDGNRRFDRDLDTQYAPELNNSRKYRFPRPSKGFEVPFNVAPNGSVGSAGRLLRPIDDQPHHSPRFPPWRLLPGPREEPLLLGARSVGCTVWDVGPDRFTEREVHDDLLRVHEEKIMRNLPGEIGDNILYPHPSLQYEPSGNDHLPRGRSPSPIQRRPPPVQLYRAHSPRQWSPPGRSPEMVIDKHPELIRHGPPPAVRVDGGSRSHPRPCFQEDVIIRRNVSPPYSQLPTDMGEMHPVSNLDLPRPGRVLQRNNRRFDLDPHESAEYFGPSHLADQLVDSRDYRNRHGLVQPWRPHHIPGDDKEDTFAYPVDGGCHRPIKFCPDGEELPARGSSRDFDSHVRNRLGNAANRLRSIADQGEDYRYHGKQGWRDGNFNDVRLKRRKL